MTLHDDLADMVEAGRAAEREVFRAISPAERDAPGPDGGWSPKDIQAHLSGWKARQVRRLAAARAGEEISPAATNEELDTINAELHAARATWPWADVEAEAERVSDELAVTIRACDDELLLSDERLLGGTMGNGPNHDLEHLIQVPGAATGARVEALADEMATIARRGGLPDREVGTVLYNLACFHALGQRLDTARGLLPEAFRLQPELVEWAAQDSDLEALRPELEALAGG
jgi:hypothetical protein